MLEAGPSLDILQARLDQFFSRLLQVAVDGRVDAETALIHTLPAEAVNELAPNLLLEIQAECLLDLERVVEVHRRGLGAFGRGTVDSAGADHCLEHDVPACDRPIKVDSRRITRWRLDQSGDERSFVHL